MKLRDVIFSSMGMVLFVSSMSLLPTHALAAKKVKTPIQCTLNAVTHAQGLKAYLSILFDKGLVKLEALKQFQENLAHGKLINPITEEMARIDAILHLHREGLDESYFSNSQVKIDLKELQRWTIKTLAKKEKARKAQQKTEKETEIPNRKMVFHKIPKGSFMTGEDKKVLIEITKDFLITDTHITQAQWVEEMGENPSFYKNGAESITAKINGKSVRLQPDHPVEFITWWSALEFANRLSLKHGLKPVYDLSKVKALFKKGTKAENGSWKVGETIKDEYEAEAANALKIISENQDFSGTEGYRMPTAAESLYVATNLGRSQTRYIFGDSEEELKDYAWFSRNSDNETHAVATKKAFVINDQPFYDLYGNVSNWIWNRFSHEIQGGKDPIGHESPFYTRLHVGGSCTDEVQNVNYRPYSAEYPSYNIHNSGLRLVRTVQ